MSSQLGLDFGFDDVEHPTGLEIVEGFLNPYEADALLLEIDRSPWMADLSRRVQHYGYRYDYRAKRVDHSMKLGPLPSWLRSIAEDLRARGWFDHEPDQAIVNEYEPGQGISAHVDCEPCFGETVASLSLASSVTMRFERLSDGSSIDVRLPERSLAVLTDDARHQWTHAIPARKSDVVDGVRVPRHRRVSVTFRSVVLS